MKITSETPKFEYRCEKDVFLGQTICEGQVMDWYLAIPGKCNGASPSGTLISQYGPEPWDEKSFPVSTFRNWRKDPNAPESEWINQGNEFLDSPKVRELLKTA